QRINAVRGEADELSARYTRAQELLSTVRAQVLLSAVTVRDVLLDPSASTVEESRQQLIASNHITTMALADYEPVTGSADENRRITALQEEIDQLQSTSLEVVADATGKTPAAIRALLNQRIGPRREAALAISEEITTLNRNAFVRLQANEARIYQNAELNSRQ